MLYGREDWFRCTVEPHLSIHWIQFNLAYQDTEYSWTSLIHTLNTVEPCLSTHWIQLNPTYPHTEKQLNPTYAHTEYSWISLVRTLKNSWTSLVRTLNTIEPHLSAHFGSQRLGWINEVCGLLKHRIMKQILCIDIVPRQKHADYRGKQIIEEHMNETWLYSVFCVFCRYLAWETRHMNTSTPWAGFWTSDWRSSELHGCLNWEREMMMESEWTSISVSVLEGYWWF